MIETNGLYKRYEDEKKMILNNIDMKINKGSFTSIMGPSGSGKSTLLHTLSGLLSPTKGTVYINNVDISKYTDSMLADLRKNEIGFVFQNSKLVDNLTVYENILLSIRIKKSNMDPIQVLKMVAMEEYKSYRPQNLSGGMAQKVNIARSLINNPSIIFADEPTGSLDSESSKMIMELLKKINNEKKITIIMVTHQLDNAMYGDRLISIKDGEIIDDKAI